MSKYYAGIGSRETPTSVMAYMMGAAWYLSMNEYILRSGGADGADTAFESGVIGNLKEIYLPHKNFNNNKSELYLNAFTDDQYRNAYEMAKKYRPNLEDAGIPTKNFMTRNMMQVLGLDLDKPVDFVLCWTKNGKDMGGTGAAIRCAKAHGIPVYNLYNEKEKAAFKAILTGMEMMKKLLPVGEEIE